MSGKIWFCADIFYIYQVQKSIMKKLLSPILSVIILLLISILGFSQRITVGSNHSDSMSGFNYLGAMNHTKEMKTDIEKFNFLNHAKRTFKIQKYDLYPQASGGNAANTNAKPGDGNSILQGPQPAGCSNIDFESQNTTGWTVTGDNTIVTGGVDPYGGFPRVFPGGTASLKLNDDNISGTKTTYSAQATRVIPVTAVNSQFQLHFAFDILNFPHPSSAAAIFYVSFFNAANTLLTCPSYSCYYANPPGQFFGMPLGVPQTSSVTGQNIGFQVYPVTYVPWQTVSMDLTPYIGQNITVKIGCNWCLYNYDWGYCYIDADCFSTMPTNTTCPGPLCGPAGMLSYTWTPPVGPVVTTSCITALTPGTYTCAYTPFTTCGAAVLTATYLVTPPPTAGFTTANTCASYTFNNTGTGAPAIQTYSFAGAGAPATFTSNVAANPVNFPTAGTFTVYQTITLGACVATASMVVNPPVAPNPAFNAVPSWTQCFTGNAFTFNAVIAGGVQTYSFSPLAGAPAPGATANYGPVSFTAPGTYTVTHTINTGGCTNITTSLVVVNPQPTVAVNNNGPICTGSNLLLTGLGGGTYSWAGPLGFTSALQNPTITAATPANAGVYTVTVTLLGCKTTGTTNVSITTPTASASNTGPYCAGTTIQLNTPAGTTYTWTGPAAFASNLQNPTRPASTIAMVGTYTVFVTTGACTSSATTNVVVNALPTPTATSNSPVCAGTPINFTGTGATTYTWTGPGAYNSPTQNPIIAAATAANAGTYTLTVTNAAGCTNFTTTNVVVNPLPVPIANNNGPLCVGNNLNLTAGGGGTYAWTGPAAFASALQNPVIPAAVLANGGVYTLLVTLNTCTASITTNVTISTATTSASNPGPFCAGTTLQLNTSPATTYTWTGPGGFNSNIQNATQPNCTTLMSGTYTVMISIGTCTAFATTNVVVNALPVPIANSNSPVCVNTPINFTGSGGTTYSWAGPGFISALQNPGIASAVAANSGTYTLTVTDVNNCTNTITTNVVVNPLPVIVVNNPTVCLNQTINITANGGTGYAWTGPGGFASGVQNPVLPNATLGMSGVYNVIVTSAAGCTSSAVSNVNVFPLPNPSITSNTPCVGNTLNLTGGGGAVFAWTGPNNFNSNAQNPNINLVTLPAAGVYTLLVTSGSCTANITSVISINPLPTPLIVSNSPVCIGMPINFTGSGGTSYSWNGPAGFSDPTQNPNIANSILANAGFYTLTVTDANGCINSISAGVQVNPQPIVTASGTTVCQNANANLSANGGVTYSWNGPAGFTSGLQNPTIVGATMVNAGQYTVLVTDANTCTNTAITSIGINPAPTPSIITNSPICINDIMNLAASGGVTYVWSGPGGFTSTSPNPTISATSVNVGGNYIVTATDANGCVASTNLNTVVNPNPPLNIVSSPNRGCAPLCVTFTCVSSASIATCNWTLGDGNNPSGPLDATTCYNTTGIYSITASVTDITGCKNSTTYTAEIYPKPIADFNYHPYHPIVNDGITFTDASFNATIAGWNWYFMSTAQYQSVYQNPNFIYTEAGVYPITLIVKSDHGCLDTVIKTIIVGEDFGIYVPNTFTPNGDGLNDVFQPKGYGIVKYALRIFDRWGEQLYYTEDFFQAWDGVYHGVLSQEDIYIWKINVVDVFSKAHEYTGHVTLIK